MAKTVLVVDDSAMMRKIVTKNLNECGFDCTIVEAADGQQGLEAFQKGGVDVVLSDWNMPNMDGLTMVKEIRKLDPEKKTPLQVCHAVDKLHQPNLRSEIDQLYQKQFDTSFYRMFFLFVLILY